MPRKKKFTLFDNRDALDILRDAFWGAEIPIVAELGTRTVKTRTAAVDKYREPVPDVPKKVSKRIKDGLLKPTIAETGEFKTFWEESSEEQEEEKQDAPETKQDKTGPELQQSIPESTQLSRKMVAASVKEGPPPHVLKDTTAKNAIDIGLVEKFNKPIKEGISLPPEDLAKLEEIRKTYEEKITKNELSTPPWEFQNKPRSKSSVVGEEPLQTPEEIKSYAGELAASIESKTPSKTPSPLRSAEKPETTTAPPETPIDVESYANRWTKAVQDRLTLKSKEAGIDLMAKRLFENPKISEKDKKEIEKIKARALEIAGAQTQMPPRNIEQSEKTSPPLDVSKQEHRDQAIYGKLTTPPQPEQESPETTARIEQNKQFLAQQEAEHYKQKHGENDIAEMKKRVQYLYEHKTKNGKTDTEAIGILQRAIEIAKAQVETAKPPEEPPSTLPPPLAEPPPPEPLPKKQKREDEIGRWENEGGALPKKSFTSPESQEQTKTREELIAAFETKTKNMEERYNKVAKTQEELREKIQLGREIEARKEALVLQYDAVVAEEKRKKLAEAPHPNTGTIALAARYERARDLITEEINAYTGALPKKTPEPLFDLGTPAPKEFVKPKADKRFAANLRPEKEARALNPEDLPKTKLESREDLVKTFQEKTATLEKIINETGGTLEEKSEHLARTTAKKYGYDVAKMEGQLAWLKKPENAKVGMHPFEIIELGSAIHFVKSELGEETPKQAPAAPEPVTPETAPTSEATPVDSDKPFEEFGISKKDIATVEGFQSLNENQKAFVFQNLQRILYGDIETRAKAMLAEETARMSATRRTGRKMFEGFAGQGGKLAVKEAEALKKIREGGVTAHGETLKLLVNLISREEVKLNPETRELEVSYINPDRFGTEFKEEVEKYNATAHRYANIPETWSYPSASKKNHKEYEAIRKQYEECRNKILVHEFARTNDDASARQFMLEQDSQVHMQRLFAAYPQMEEVIKDVKHIETQDIAKAGRHGFYKESGWKAGIAGLSGITRYSSIQFFALSATEAAVGVGTLINSTREAYRARIKAREELEAARQNLTKKEIAAAKLKAGRSHLGLGGLVKGVGKKELRTAGQSHRRTTMIDAANYAERVDHLLRNINDPKTAVEKRRLSEKHLYRLVRMAEEHVAEGLVNFGRGSSRLVSSYEFVNKLSHAQVELVQKGFFREQVAKPELYVFDDKEKVSIEKFMDQKLKRLSREERQFVLRGFARGLAVGAVAGGVGAAFGGWLRENYGVQIQEWTSDAREKLGKAAAWIGIGNESIVLGPPENLPVGPEKTPFVPESGSDALEIPPAKSPTATPLETAPAKKLDLSRFKTSHPVDMEASRPFPETPRPRGDTFTPEQTETALGEPGAGDKTVNWEALKKPPKVSPDTGKVLTPQELETAQRTYQGLGEPGAGDKTVHLETGAEYAKLAEIKKGEGMWHAIRRQLNYQMSHSSPEEFANRYGLSAEDIKLHPKKSVERITANLLAEQEYIKPKGAGGAWTETRITKPGTHVLLGEDGNIEITGKGKLTYEWQKTGAVSETPVKTGATVLPEKAPIISEHLLSQPENMARKMSGLRLEKYVAVRDTPLAEFLKKPPHGKGFHLLAKVLRREKPLKADLQQTVSEFLTKHFGR